MIEARRAPPRKHVELFPCLGAVALARVAERREAANLIVWRSGERRIGYAHFAYASDADALSVSWFTYTMPDQPRRGGTTSISVGWTKANVGGERVHLLCPACGDEREKLYLVANQWACRRCHRLVHRTQRMSTIDRNFMKIDDLRRQLAWDGKRVHRPKGMHNSTYVRLVNELHDVEHRTRGHTRGVLNHEIDEVVTTSFYLASAFPGLPRISVPDTGLQKLRAGMDDGFDDTYDPRYPNGITPSAEKHGSLLLP